MSAEVASSGTTLGLILGLALQLIHGGSEEGRGASGEHTTPVGKPSNRTILSLGQGLVLRLICGNNGEVKGQAASMPSWPCELNRQATGRQVQVWHQSWTCR